LVSLIAWLAIFYNIERIFDEQYNIATFVYVLVLGLSIPLFLSPRLFTKQPVALTAISLGLYGILKIALGYPTATNLLVTVGEIAGILITIFLIRQITIIIMEFEDTIANITINLLGIPPRLRDNDLEEVYREVRRARRFQHPITLAVVKGNYDSADIDINEVVQVIQRGMQESFLQARLIKLLADTLKESDIIVRSEKDLVIALPHTDPAEVRRIFESINLQTMQWGLPLQIGLASFPDAGTTLQTLLENAVNDINGVEIRPEHATDPSYWLPQWKGDGVGRLLETVKNEMTG
jgi:hypothetical protein